MRISLLPDPFLKWLKFSNSSSWIPTVETLAFFLPLCFILIAQIIRAEQAYEFDPFFSIVVLTDLGCTFQSRCPVYRIVYMFKVVLVGKGNLPRNSGFRFA